MPNRSKSPVPRLQPPMPVTVSEDAFHRPLFVTYLGEELRVDSIDQQWQADAEPWERKRVGGLYYKVMFAVRP